MVIDLYVLGALTGLGVGALVISGWHDATQARRDAPTRARERWRADLDALGEATGRAVRQVEESEGADGGE